MSGGITRGDLYYSPPGQEQSLPSDSKAKLSAYFAGCENILRAYFVSVSRRTGERGFQLAVQFDGGSPHDVSEEQRMLVKRIYRDTRELIKSLSQNRSGPPSSGGNPSPEGGFGMGSKPNRHFGVLIVNNLDAWLGPGGKDKFIAIAELLFVRDDRAQGINGDNRLS